MANKDFIFNVTTLAGCKYSILKELEENYHVEKAYRKKAKANMRTFCEEIRQALLIQIREENKNGN